MTLTPDEFQQWAIAVIAAIGALTTTVLVPAAVRLAPILVTSLAPMLRAKIKGARDQAAFDAVTRAGIRASSVAAEAYASALNKAAAPDSESGTVVTDAEREAALKLAWDVAADDLKRQGVVDDVLEVYGTEDDVRSAIRSIVRNGMFGRPQG